MAKPKTPNNPLQRQREPNPIHLTEAESGSLQIRQEVRTSQFQGPIPPPELLREYEAIVPGAADRIITVMENQASHRMFLERTVITGDSMRAYLGIAAGFISTLTLFGLATWLIATGHGAEGVAMATANIAALVGVFVHGTRMRQQEREEKRQSRGRKANP